jgi:hypothetical protein
VPSIQRCACSHGCGSSSSSGTTIETVPRRARKATPRQRQPRRSGNARAGQRDSIASMAKSVRGTSSVAVHRLNVAAGVGFIESVLRLIHAATEDDELTARQFRVLGHCVFGAGIDETAGYARGAVGRRAGRRRLHRPRGPAARGRAPFFQPAHWDATWKLGIDALLERGRQDAKAHGVAPAQATRRGVGRGSAA